MPLSAAGTEAAHRQTLITQASSITSKVASRVAQLDALDAPAATPEARRDHALAQLRIVFGKSFIVLPRFAASNAAEFARALGNSVAVQQGDAFAALTWFRRTARVRDGVARLNRVPPIPRRWGMARKSR